MPVSACGNVLTEQEHMKNVIHIAFACCIVRHTEGFYLSIVHLQAVKFVLDVVNLTCRTVTEI